LIGFLRRKACLAGSWWCGSSPGSTHSSSAVDLALFILRERGCGSCSFNLMHLYCINMGMREFRDHQDRTAGRDEALPRSWATVLLCSVKELPTECKSYPSSRPY
jgi:hypothetical protein